MRLFWITVPAGLAFASAGGLMYLAAMGPHTDGQGFEIPQERHPVTPEMERETAALAKRVATAFETKDFEGKPVTIAPANGERPQFVYFVLDGCPCSYDAEPLFQRLSKRYKGKIDFVTITNADEKKAREWSVQMLVPYPVISDPGKEIIGAYEAKSSVYSALITKDGRIAKMWPGYSQKILADQNALMAKLTGVKETPFDAQYAPEEKSTGCAF
ncbi:MAG: peroxiredoxin family protein [Fimbriimonas sp.]